MKKLIVIFILFPMSIYSNIEWGGHRGAAGLYPENTIEGMKRALQYPDITILEMDIAISKDLEVIISHDPWINSAICLDPNGETIVGKGFNLFQLNFDEISKFDCGSKYYNRFPDQVKVTEHKPRLADLIFEIERDTKFSGKYFIDLKWSVKNYDKGYYPNIDEYLKLILKVIDQSGVPRKRFIFGSLDWQTLKMIHQIAPDLTLVASSVLPLSPDTLIKRLGFKPEIFFPFHLTLTKNCIKKFHDKGIKVYAWTVDTRKSMKSLIDKNIDGILTNYPNKINEIRDL